MKLKILSFEWTSLVQKDVISVTLLTGIGEITVLENHVPLMTYVEPSTLYIDYKDENGVRSRDDFAVWRWVVQIDWKQIKEVVTGATVFKRQCAIHVGFCGIEFWISAKLTF